MSYSDKNLGGNPQKRLRDTKGRFRKKDGKNGEKNKQKLKRNFSKKQLKRKSSKNKLKTPKKQQKQPKKKGDKSLKKKAKTLPIAYGHVYSDSCGHCRDMQPDWDQLKSNIGQSVELCDIGDNHSYGVRQFNDRFDSTLNFDGFPTVFKLQNKGNAVEYYDDYYKKQKDAGKQLSPFRSQESMRVWILGG